MFEPKTARPGRTRIIGTGAGMPSRVLTNYELEQMVETNNEWIVQRTGIRERRIAVDGESTLTFALEASRAALAEAGLKGADLDMIIVGTDTPDMVLPSTACLLQSHLEAGTARAFDLKAGCTGWIYGMVVADQFIRNHPVFKVLVVGAELLSRSLDWTDRTTCVLFGDGAGAAVVTGGGSGDEGLISTCLQADGSQWEALTMVGGGTIHGFTREMIDQKLWAVKMEGNRVFRLAVQTMEETAWSLLSDGGFNPKDVDVFIPHQANIRIMEAVAERLGIPREKVVVNVDRYGNTSTATIPVALAEISREGRVKKGDLVMMVSFGGGFTWGGLLMRW